MIANLCLCSNFVLIIGTLRTDDKNADISAEELGREVAVVIDVVGHFVLTNNRQQFAG